MDYTPSPFFHSRPWTKWHVALEQLSLSCKKLVRKGHGLELRVSQGGEVDTSQEMLVTFLHVLPSSLSAGTIPPELQIPKLQCQM